MDLGLAAVAESLAHEFGELRSSTVIRVVTDCVDEYPCCGPHFIEQAARARLTLVIPPQTRRTMNPGRDSLDVSLHDHELADEVELTAVLMVAANESATALDQDEVDEILGVQRRRRTA
ncbi:MAG TPA: hypothetical protein VFZ64_05675 [Nocardioidaceae bacterium]